MIPAEREALSGWDTTGHAAAATDETPSYFVLSERSSGPGECRR